MGRTIGLALQSDDALLSLARKTLASREDSLRLVQLRAAHGAASDLDLRSAQTRFRGGLVQPGGRDGDGGDGGKVCGAGLPPQKQFRQVGLLDDAEYDVDGDSEGGMHECGCR